MRKVIMLILAFSLLLPFIEGQKQTFAATGGLLNGKEIGSGFINFTSAGTVALPSLTSNEITDGDVTTGRTIALYPKNGTYDGYIYEFPTTADINGYMALATGSQGDYYGIFFYNASGVKVGGIYHPDTSTSVVLTGQSTPIPQIKGVKRVLIIWGSSNSDGVPGSIKEFDVFGTELPSAPTNLTAFPGDKSASLNWNAVTGAASYNIKRSTTAGGPYTTLATGITDTTYSNTGLTNGTTYYYIITAVNSSGESSNSNEASATPLSSNRALLTIHLIGGAEKEYDVSAAELEAFLAWTDSATQSSRYKFVKTWNKGPFNARAEYIVYGKIVNFDVDEY